MSFWLILGIALALAMDAFAVSMGLACGQAGLSRAQRLRLGFSFGLFQFMMPVFGWFAGEGLIRHIRTFDHWLAFLLLVAVGGRMVYESFHKEAGNESSGADRTRGLSLLVLSLATSIDALAVGLSLGVLRAAILYPAAIIGVVCFSMTVLAAKIGPLAGRLAGKRAELVGGLVLIAIGAKILVDHLAQA